MRGVARRRIHSLRAGQCRAPRRSAEQSRLRQRGRADLLYQRDYFTAVIDYAARARKEGRAREELAKVEVLPRFEHFGGIKSRLGLALTIAYDELAKMG